MSAAAAIAHALRGKPTCGGYLIRCPVPSHGNGKGDRNPSLMIRDGDKPGRVLVHCYAGCEAVDVLAALRNRNVLEPSAELVASPATSIPPKHEPDAAALAIWRSGMPITSDHQTARFLAARGITLAPPPIVARDDDQSPRPLPIAGNGRRRAGP
jgi:hypothetical protein